MTEDTDTMKKGATSAAFAWPSWNESGAGLVVAGTVLWLAACGDGSSPTPSSASESPAARYVGREACASCHEEETELWTGSHHDLAMQEATEETVLGNFDDVTFSWFGVTSRFFRRDGKFLVRTDGPDGKLADFEVKYAFGVTPLQQYLVETQRGRLQTLPLCWDARPKDKGGQRWFHVYPGERIDHEDELHWTGPNQNWNHMCAECHSTDLKSGYDLETDTFTTTWREIDVSCEACHGPGSRHVDWAGKLPEDHQPGEPPLTAAEMGLVVGLRGLPDAAWVLDKETGTAKRTGPMPSSEQVETCGRCHSRRGTMSQDYLHGKPLLDTHRVSLLSENLYYPDGQIQDEVYVYGSFVQSRMFHQGVVCTDCHEPHGLKLRSSGNTLCYRCHLPEKFDTPDHHHHEAETAGAACVSCHMPRRNYMVVDPRLDHSIRIPRPDLSLTLGTPNACNKCHDDRDAAWSVAAMDRWYGTKWQKPHYGEALHAGRTGAVDAAQRLAALARDTEQPGIVRGTALEMLSSHLRPESLDALALGRQDEDALVRLGVALALESLPVQERTRLGAPLLEDEVISVRAAAARWLAAVPQEQLTAAQRLARDRAISEYEQSQLASGDRAWAHVNLSGLYRDLGDAPRSQASLETAIRLEPGFAPGWVNLADLYRAGGDDARSLATLEKGARQVPSSPGLQHALGLALVRVGRKDDALAALRLAATLDPADPRIAYAWGLALNSEGRAREALQVLAEALDRHPADQEILFALATINRDEGNLDAALQAATRLANLLPDNPSIRRLVEDLRTGRRR